MASRSNPRCSKAQIASYLAQIRRFLAPTAWASSTSTTKKISPQATQACFRKGSRRFWACIFWAMVGKGPWLFWHACGTIGWNSTMTNLYISPCPCICRLVPTPAGIAEAHWQAQGMPGSSCHLPQIPLFLKVARQKTTYFGEIGRFFPMASRSNPRCSKVQIASYWAQIRRFLALAPQRMSHLFGKDRLFFGDDNVNVFNFWISLKKPVIIIS